jgi:hypothetical protein
MAFEPVDELDPLLTTTLATQPLQKSFLNLPEIVDNGGAGDQYCGH